MNANTFVNNANGVGRQLYRFMTVGYNFSGPIYVPGKFNTNKDKLFIFLSNEWNRSKQPGTLQQLTVPTAAQRGGDFSNTRDAAGVLRLQVLGLGPLDRQAFTHTLVQPREDRGDPGLEGRVAHGRRSPRA